MSASSDSKELFLSIQNDSINHLKFLLSHLKASNPEALYTLLTQRHLQKNLTALQWAIQNYPKTSIDSIEILLNYGAGTEFDEEFYSEDTITNTPLWMAVERNLPLKLVKLLLSFKADVYYKASDEKSPVKDQVSGYSLLHLAILKQHEHKAKDYDLITVLIDSGGEILLNDQGNHEKETPLMLAVKQNNLKLVRLLLDCGAKLDLKNASGLSAYELAACQELVEICLVLQNEHLNDPNSLIYYLQVLEKNKSADLDDLDDLLPIEGYWEWISESWTTWQDDCIYRLRKRKEITGPPYLKTCIELVRQSNLTYALKLLLDGLQHETNFADKTLAAKYFQRLLKRVEPVSSVFSLSQTDLVVLSDDSEDSLLYCPVCSHRFNQSKDRETHLTACLSAPKHQIIGDRYTNLSRRNLLPGEECPICFEDFGEVEQAVEVVVMNCLCRFHEKCIKEWLGRGKQCPFHSKT